MVLRALIAVLTLVGAVPFRVCTCGAAHTHHHASPPPAHDAPDPCGHSACAPQEEPPQHDHDCPAVKPRCAMAVAVPATPADTQFGEAPIAPLPQLSVLAPRPTSPGAKPRSPDPPPDRPLYLTLLTLRN